MKQKIIIIISLIVTLSLSQSPLFAENFDSFKASNYVYLEENSPSSESDLKKLIQNSEVFLYVSGCYLDKEALPAFQALTKRYPQAKFIRISQHGSTKDYMLKRYGSHGAPNLYFFHNGSIVSSMPYYYKSTGGKTQFMGWKQSIDRWASTIWPYVSKLKNYPNIYAVSSFNYKKVMRNKKAVLLRTDTTRSDYGSAMKSLFAAAGKYPDKIFTLDSGEVPYNQEFTFKFRKAYDSFSIVSNSDSIEASIRKPYNQGYNEKQIIDWIGQQSGSKSESGDQGRDGNFLKKVLQDADSYTLATMNAGEFKRINSKYRVLSSFPMQQSFYVLVNAVTDSRRDKATALALINELRYDSQGGFAKAVPNALLRQKVYAPVIERIISYEDDSDIKNELEKILELYSR